MDYQSYIEDIGPATECVVVKDHLPRPVVFCWHHILPLEAGGLSTPENLVSVCINCHHTINHYMLDLVKNDGKFTEKYGPWKVRLLARQGYDAAKAAGTLDRIPV